MFVISAVQFVSEEEALQEAALTHLALEKNNNVLKNFKRVNFT